MSVARIALAASFAMLASQDARADDVVGAQEHLDRGVAAYGAGDFAAAQRELTRARELAPDKPNPYRWLALTGVQLGQCAQAVVHVEAFLSRVPAADPRVGELVRLRELCQRTGVVQFDSTPGGATIVVDDQALGVTPSLHTLRAGSHRVVANLPGYASAARSVVVPPAGELAVMFALSRETVPVTRRWWLWTALGVVAASATVGVIYLATRDSDGDRLPSIACDMTGCHP